MTHSVTYKFTVLVKNWPPDKPVYPRLSERKGKMIVKTVKARAPGNVVTGVWKIQRLRAVVTARGTSHAKRRVRWTKG